MTPYATDTTSTVVLRPVADEQDLDLALVMLRRAGRTEAYVRSALERGDIFALYDLAGCDDACLLAVALVERSGGGTMSELRLVAVRGDRQREGLGVLLLMRLQDYLRSTGARTVIARAGNADVGTFGLLQKAGFRISYIEHDADPIRGGWPTGVTRNGIVQRDLISFRLDL